MKISREQLLQAAADNLRSIKQADALYHHRENHPGTAAVSNFTRILCYSGDSQPSGP
jgi:hypothetical protein